ncbi:hypothetical protein HPP92_003276 [Vanilla planifolia]|uniref:Uncharacterized protein n=1 Tax=Vanilla planifolia TaxID=51239 RepID=A0A835S7T8_VANPL|nr:hypothetical protein HPP92_003276 [Vanilla planifolia]
MTRRCSHCSNNGHNSRTCPSRGGGGMGGVKLFGVRLTEGVRMMKKSASMGSLSSAAALCAPSSAAESPSHLGSPRSDTVRNHGAAASGYASDDPEHASCSSNCRSERKKGTPWTEEEHRMFLLGLQKLGKGDWRGIARNFVVSKTPTQVASHAQKYFIRQANVSRRKRRSSLFDMVPEQLEQAPGLEDQPLQPPASLNKSENANKIPASPEPEEKVLPNNADLPMVPAFYPTFVHLPIPFWPGSIPTPSVREEEMADNHEVLKPTPMLPRCLVNADEIVGLSKLSISERSGCPMKPSALSIKLLESSTSRQSAFHVNSSVSSHELTPNGSSVIHAV